ncbi:hypothetical protein B4U79_19012 [Dinothrombium tinctorium]|uniref:C-type lectin domain-containing protein n=1 Tax=Dinothrombium tinctorium TaxID=1965070 RepID=A0A3S3NWU5_9ACAR|nr:hypothetical protein B4U79_19048 [Dinothrombium tinctorium]RWS07626.1 hypothetical protein B4U79_19043 [Dinothrombium tinctorium]RWS09693.1 hypothetical protein B4U79_19013 [Dinothrombium tinctorium]RWS09713.1 hypothetical protein B4U79_19012 [Dinothrombium tinctorium]
MVSIHSREENIFLVNYIFSIERSFKLNNTCLWLGLRYNLESKRVEWLDGSPLNFTNWRFNPITSDKLNGQNAVCLASDGFWHLRNKKALSFSLCQKISFKSNEKDSNYPDKIDDNNFNVNKNHFKSMWNLLVKNENIKHFKDQKEFKEDNECMNEQDGVYNSIYSGEMNRDLFSSEKKNFTRVDTNETRLVEKLSQSDKRMGMNTLFAILFAAAIVINVLIFITISMVQKRRRWRCECNLADEEIKARALSIIQTNNEGQENLPMVA